MATNPETQLLCTMEEEGDDSSGGWSDYEFDDEKEKRREALESFYGKPEIASSTEAQDSIQLDNGSPSSSTNVHPSDTLGRRDRTEEPLIALSRSGDDGMIASNAVGRYSEDSGDSQEKVVIANDDFQDYSESHKNGFGVIHVTVLEVRNLSCPQSSQVQTICHLLPWKGKVKLDPQVAILRDNAICLQRNNEISMVHSYSDSNSPIPKLKVVLVLKLGFVEFNMAALEISCRSFIEQPGFLFHKWFRMSGNVLIHLEAKFEPLKVPIASTEEPAETNKQTIIDNKQTLHLFQKVSYKMTPATCCSCQKPINWRTAFQCELCKIDCCQDCRVQVDLSVPCGSQKAKQLAAAAIQNKFTVDNVLNIIAPTDHLPAVASPNVSPVNSAKQVSVTGSIGKLKLQLLQAYVLVDSISALADPQQVLEKELYRPGDYYVRIHGTETVRTRTIQQSNGQPNLQDNGELVFVVPHYGTEFKIEVIDANVDKVIGSSFITTQGLLQRQRDFLIEEKGSPFSSFLYPKPCREPLDLVLELRTEMDKSLDYFSPPPTSGQVSKPGDIAGCIRVRAVFEEDFKSLYGKHPYLCPGRPGEALNMSIFQMHLARISTIVENLKHCVALYQYVVGWEDPVVTLLSLIVFLQLCSWFNPAYIGSVPFFLVISVMAYLAYKRFRGKIKNVFIQREIEKNRKVRIKQDPRFVFPLRIIDRTANELSVLQAEKSSITYDVHRPIGILQVSVTQGRNIRSPELGIPGNVCCRLYWDPTKYMTEQQKKLATAVDQSTTSVHELGSTEFVYSKDPSWDRILESENTKRLKMLVPSLLDALDHSATDAREILVPVLQPIRNDGDISSLSPWEDLSGALSVEVQFSDVLNILPGSEYTVGRVVVPFSQLIDRGKTFGWFDIFAEEETGLKLPISKDDGDKSDHPQVYLQARWNPPETNTGIPIEMEREASHAIQEEMVRSAFRTQQEKEKLSILGSSIGALNTVRGISGNLLVVQNSLGAVLDVAESLMHLCDFTVRRLAACCRVECSILI